MRAKKTDIQKKCERVVRLLLEKVNSFDERGSGVTFERDWGGNSMTIVITGEGHTHVGGPDLPIEVMLDNLIGALGGGGGHLSFAK